MITASDEWERRLRIMAPAEFLADRPLYITSDIPAPFSSLGCFACTSPSADFWLEPSLRKRGVWRGRGFAIMLCDAVAFWAADELLQWAVVLHEAAHFLSQLDGWRLMNDQAVRAYLLTEPPVIMAPEVQRAPLTLPPWDAHEDRWIRCAIHLQWRAAWHGWRVPLGALLVAGDRYGLSDAEAYQQALGDEPYQQRGEAMEAILNSDAPEAFRALWQRDTTPAGTTAAA